MRFGSRRITLDLDFFGDDEEFLLYFDSAMINSRLVGYG